MCLLFRLSEAEMAITGNNLLKSKSHEEILQDFGDTASFALQLLAQVYRSVVVMSPADIT